VHIDRYEKIWLNFGIGALIVFLLVLGINAFTVGNHPPTAMATIDPAKVKETEPFNNPGVKQIDENTYEVDIIAQAFSYTPNKIQVPAGKKIIFKVTSPDVVHSFTIVGTNVNMMVVPGHINVAWHTFDKPGKYLILCNEYCGAGHQLMAAEIEVVQQ